MLARLLAHLRQQWMGALALFLVLTGGIAYATHEVIRSSDIVNNQVFPADVRDDTLSGGGLTAADLRAGSVGTTEIATGGVRSGDVLNESLTGADVSNSLTTFDVLDETLGGADIADQSGVDTCVLSERLGQLCARGENFGRTWFNALMHCANIDLRLPSFPEALELAKTHDIPNVTNEFFWTDERVGSGADESAFAVNEDGSFALIDTENLVETLCVTTPTN